MEDGEIADDGDVLMVIGEDPLLMDNYEDMSMELDNNSEIAGSQPLRDHEPDEADTLRELLLSQVKKKRRSAVPNGELLDSLFAFDPQHSAAIGHEETNGKRQKSKKDKLKSPDTDCHRVEEGLGKLLKQLDGMKREFTAASASYESARKRRREYTESIAQCDAKLAKYQRTMEGLWESMVKLSAEVASTCLKEVKRIRSGQSQVGNTIEEQQRRLGESEREIAQLRAKNRQLAESIEARSPQKRMGEKTASKRLPKQAPPKLIPLSPIHVVVGEEAVTPVAGSKETAPPRATTLPKQQKPRREEPSVKNTGSTSGTPLDGATPSVSDHSQDPTSWRQLGPAKRPKHPTPRYFQAESEEATTPVALAPSVASPSKKSGDSVGTMKPTRVEPSGLQTPHAKITSEKSGTPQTRRQLTTQPVKAIASSPLPESQTLAYSTRAPPSNGHHFGHQTQTSARKAANPGNSVGNKIKSPDSDSFVSKAVRLSPKSIDPLLPLCPYMLTGRCADDECPWQHSDGNPRHGSITPSIFQCDTDGEFTQEEPIDYDRVELAWWRGNLDGIPSLH